eukprot:GEMP01030646.1.p1 GENE.GEMP01030646.1~~GEMP01030646.1.p1  ORF type:complete len:312 (+),score=41.76 GEMP01030646.1:183-1118(+)
MTNGKGKNNRRRFVPLELDYLNYSFAKKDPVYNSTTGSYSNAVRNFGGNPTSPATPAPTVYAPQPVRNDNLSWAARMARPASQPERYAPQTKAVTVQPKAVTPVTDMQGPPSTDMQGPPSTDMKTDSVADSPKSTITRNWSDMHEEPNAWGNAETTEPARELAPSSIEEIKPLTSYEIIEPEEWTEGMPWQPTISRLVLAPELLAMKPPPRQSSTFYDACERKSSFNDNNAGYAVSRRNSYPAVDSWLCSGCHKYYTAGWFANDDQWYCNSCHWAHDENQKTTEKVPKKKSQGGRKTYYVKKRISAPGGAV